MVEKVREIKTESKRVGESEKGTVTDVAHAQA